MYEEYYGLAEKPFSLTPDPKFLYRGESHGGAFDLLKYAVRRRQSGGRVMGSDRVLPQAGAPGRQLPDGAVVTILAAAFLLDDPASPSAARALTEWLESSGYRLYYAEVELGVRGRWQRVLAGAYTDPEVARFDAARLNEAGSGLAARVVTAGFATGSAP